MQYPFDLTSTVQLVKDPGAPDNGGNKRQHNSDNLDSDKDNGQIIEETHLTLISTAPTQGAWCNVEKNKGRKS